MKSLSLSKPHVIAVVGIPGSGKTTFAEKFAETFNAPCVSLERIATLAEGCDDVSGVFGYQLQELLKTGQSIIVDGKSDARADRMELAKFARSCGYEILLVWIQTDAATARSRAQKRASEENVEQRTKRFTNPNHTEKQVVVSGKHTYASQARVVLKKLSSPRAEISTHTTPPVREKPADMPTSGRRNITIR